MSECIEICCTFSGEVIWTMDMFPHLWPDFSRRIMTLPSFGCKDLCSCSSGLHFPLPALTTRLYGVKVHDAWPRGCGFKGEYWCGIEIRAQRTSGSHWFQGVWAVRPIFKHFSTPMETIRGDRSSKCHENTIGSHSTPLCVTDPNTAGRIWPGCPSPLWIPWCSSFEA